jgi:hypothetical protein
MRGEPPGSRRMPLSLLAAECKSGFSRPASAVTCTPSAVTNARAAPSVSGSSGVCRTPVERLPAIAPAIPALECARCALIRNLWALSVPKSPVQPPNVVMNFSRFLINALASSDACDGPRRTAMRDRAAAASPWDAEFAVFEATDAAHPPAAGGILFAAARQFGSGATSRRSSSLLPAS